MISESVDVTTLKAQLEALVDSLKKSGIQLKISEYGTVNLTPITGTNETAATNLVHIDDEAIVNYLAPHATTGVNADGETQFAFDATSLSQAGRALINHFAHLMIGAQPMAWMTHHDEPMLFRTKKEAALYCDPDEEPIAMTPMMCMLGD